MPHDAESVRYPHVNVAGACARALKSDCRPFPPMTARNGIRDLRNPLKIEIAFWVTFWVSWDFVPNRFSVPHRTTADKGKRKIPDISYQGIRELVGAEGFEPSAFWSRTKRATRLRYAPW